MDTQVAGIGTPARDGTFEFTVTAVTYAGKGGNQVPGKTAQGRYVLLHMTVKNICQVGRRPGKVGY